jgi:hypothetical protein
MRAAIWRVLVACLVAAPASAAPCCGPITPDGRRLAAVLDASDVGHLWLPHTAIDWSTGVPEAAQPGRPALASHCSAYAAAMAKRMGVYLLRPPRHGQMLLADAQFRWLQGPGAQAGWRQVDAPTAQGLANRGALVVAAFSNPDPHRPGHIAVLRPSLKSEAALDADGPQEAQAGARNALDTTIAAGFADHRGAWPPVSPGGVRFFAHDVDWTR